MNFLEVCGILFWVLVILGAIFWGAIVIGAKSEDEIEILKEQQYKKVRG